MPFYFSEKKTFERKKNCDERFLSLIGRNTSPLCICIKADSLEEKAVVGGSSEYWYFFWFWWLNMINCKKNCLFCLIKLSEILGSSLESKKPIGIACPMGSMRPIGIGKNRTPKTPNRPALLENNWWIYYYYADVIYTNQLSML